MSTRLLHLRLRGMVAVHAARAVHTALGAVQGISSATVTMAGAEIDVVGPYDPEALAAQIRAALEPIGVALEGMTVMRERMLPLA